MLSQERKCFLQCTTFTTFNTSRSIGTHYQHGFEQKSGHGETMTADPVEHDERVSETAKFVVCPCWPFL